MSDIATKEYVDGRLAQRGAFFPRIAWAFVVDFIESAHRSRLLTLKYYGINSVLVQRHIDDWVRPGSIYRNYDMIYDVAAEYGMKVYWYTGIHRILIDPRASGYDCDPYINPDTNQFFPERYKTHPACGGWEWGDEPNYQNFDHENCKQAHDDLNIHDPYHPNFAVFGYDLSKNYATSFRPGCELYGVGCCDIHAIDLWGDDWQTNLHWWLEYTDHFPPDDPLDGWLDCNKGMLPCIQAYVGRKPEDPGYGMVPDCKEQFDIWKQYYPFRTQMKGIGFWNYTLFITGGADGLAIRNSIKEVSRATGWIED